MLFDELDFEREAIALDMLKILINNVSRKDENFLPKYIVEDAFTLADEFIFQRNKSE